MVKTDEKLKRISFMVMEEANKVKNEIISKAETEYLNTIKEQENILLENSYRRIQKTVEKIERECNQKIIDAVISNKRSLLNRREELVESFFVEIKRKLLLFKLEEKYKSYLRWLIAEGLTNIGFGEIILYADSDDLSIIEEIRDQLSVCFELVESEEELLGGYILKNKTKGLLYDYSIKGSLEDERKSFLEKYDLPIKDV